MEQTKTQKGTADLSIQAGKWMSLGAIIQKILLFFTFIILSRLLLPADFGFIAIVAIIPSTLDLITSFNFESSLIHKKIDPLPYLSAIWTFNLIKSLLIIILVILSAPFVINFFNLSADKIWLVRLSGLLILLPNLANVGQFYLFRDLDFKKIFFRDLSSTIIYSVGTIGLSLIFHSYWAIFWGSILQLATGMIISYFLHPYRPRIDAHLLKLSDLIGYSSWVYGQAIVGQIGSVCENSVIGKFGGPSNLGLYSKAKGLATAPISPLSGIIRKIGFPAFARVQDSSKKVSEGVRLSFDILFLVAIPFISLILLSGKDVVLFLLGPNWLGMTAVLSIMTIALSINAFSITITEPLLNAIGQSKLQFNLRLFFTASFVIFLLILTPRFGIIGAAYASLSASILVSGYCLFKLKNYFRHIPFKKLTISLFSIILATVIASVVGLYLKQVISLTNKFLVLGTMILVGLIYLLFIFLISRLFRRGPWDTVQFILIPIYSSIKRFLHAQN